MFFLPACPFAKKPDPFTAGASCPCRIRKDQSAILIFLVLTLAAGCSGGSSGSSSPAKKNLTLAGTVSDGPVKNATVTLLDPDGNTAGICMSGNCTTATDENGRFSFSLRDGVLFSDLSGFTVISGGGLDTETGNTGPDMRLLMDTATDSEAETLSVNPAATLTAGIMEAGISLSGAIQRTAACLGVSSDALKTPDEILKKRMMLLVYIGELSGGGLPATVTHVLDGAVLVDGAGNLSDADSDLFSLLVPEEWKDAARSVCGEVLAETRPAADILGQAYVHKAVMDYFQRMLEPVDPDFTDSATQAVYMENAEILADQIAMSRTIPLHDQTLARIMDYVLTAYGLVLFSGETEPEENRLSTPLSSEALARNENGAIILLENDPVIPEIIQAGVEFPVVVPLPVENLPGNDNQKRMEYYYHSDLSHLYQAEKLTLGVLDDTINDDIMKEVATGLAEDGLLDEAESCVRTRIFSARIQADGYRSIAKALLAYGKTAEDPSGFERRAKSLFETAFALYQKQIESLGKAYLQSEDADGLYMLSLNCSSAGFHELSEEVLTYYMVCVDAMSTENFSALSRIAAALNKSAKTLLEENNADAAFAQVLAMVPLAQRIPANDADEENVNFKARVYSLAEAFDRYLDLAAIDPENRSVYHEEARSVFSTISALRAAYPETSDNTEIYMGKTVIPGLFILGQTEEAMALYDVLEDKYKKYVYNARATYYALSGDMTAAFAVVDQEIEDPEDRITALLYYTENPNTSPCIAAALIDAGNFDSARTAMEKAEALIPDVLAAFADDEAKRYNHAIQNGYIKIATLHVRMGDHASAEAALSRAENLAASFLGAQNRISSRIDMASVFTLMGNSDAARNAMETAIADAGALTVSDLVSADDICRVFQGIADAYRSMDQPEKAVSAIKEMENRIPLIFDLSLSDADWDSGAYGDHEALLKQTVYRWTDAAVTYEAAGDTTAARSALNEAVRYADLIYAENDFVDLINGKGDHPGIAPTLASAGDIDGARTLAENLRHTADRYAGILNVAKVIALEDRFPESPKNGPKHPEFRVASVDTDRDGRPDFFNPLATAADIAASGLVLDDDSDGDGIPDTEDRRPLYPDAP